MVLNVGALKDGRFDYVFEDIEKVINSSKPAIVKVILETCYLNDDEIVKACEISKKAGAHFVKTSTGFGSAGATEHHVALMRNSVGNDTGVKASGGISDLETAKKMINAGANRIGASAGIKIISELRNERTK